LVFHLLHIQEFLPVGSSAYRLVVSSSNYTLVAGGMVISALLTHFKGQEKKILLSLLLIGLLVMVYGYALRPYWGGFSKIRATPSWTLVSLGWSVLSFWVLYILVDLFKWSRWARPFYTAGRYTLTCYVLPYAVYQIMVLTNTVYWPSPWSVGLLGLLKAAVFSFLILGATALLVRFRIALKL
jgi:heparan-alpha-glucosaminide N-acetyltransferase